MRSLKRLSIGGAGIAATCALLVAMTPAQATTAPRADAKPKVGCGGMSFTDPAGDTSFALVVDLPLSQNPNLDVTGGWFNWDGSQLTANIQIANLDKSPPTIGDGSITWYMWWTGSDDTNYFVSADYDGSAITYSYGDLGTGVETLGATKGTFNEGKDGVISIVVPGAATKAAEGATLKTPYARTVPRLIALLPTADYGPDSQAGKAYKVGACVDGGSAVAGATGAGGAAALPVTVSPKGGSAAKASKSKSATVKFTASEALTAIKAKLLKGKKVVGSGSLASANGAAKLKLKLKGKIKKGSYTLKLTGKKADGTSASATAKVTFS